VVVTNFWPWRRLGGCNTGRQSDVHLFVAPGRKHRVKETVKVHWWARRKKKKKKEKKKKKKKKKKAKPQNKKKKKKEKKEKIREK